MYYYNNAYRKTPRRRNEGIVLETIGLHHGNIAGKNMTKEISVYKIARMLSGFSEGLRYLVISSYSPNKVYRLWKARMAFFLCAFYGLLQR